MVVLWRGLSAAGGVEGERKKERERARKVGACFRSFVPPLVRRRRLVLARRRIVAGRALVPPSLSLPSRCY